jgi:hypothetical protein
VIVGWSKSWPEVPDCGLKQVYLQQLGAFCEALGEGFLKAFHVGFRKALVKASMEASIDPSPHPSRNQDQDQDQDQDQISLSRARAIITAQPPSDPELERRQSLRKQIWGKLDALRREIASELGEDIQPLLAFDPGEAALAMRIVEAGDQASARCEHVLAVLAAEARGKQTVQFLTGAVFEPPSWRRLLGMSVKDIEKSLSRAGPRSAPPEQPRRIKTL